MADRKGPEIRLLKVIVQPVVVVDDGNSLEEVPVDPITVPAAEWPTYATGRFKDQLKGLQNQLSAAAQAQKKG